MRSVSPQAQFKPSLSPVQVRKPNSNPPIQFNSNMVFQAETRFSTKLISSINYIFSPDDRKLEDIFSTLHDLSAQLEQREQATPVQKSFLIPSKDCEDLLSGLQAVEVQHGRDALWKTVKAAFRSPPSSRKIADIKGQLERTQRLLSVHVGLILTLVKTLRSLESETRQHGIDQASKICALNDIMQASQTTLRSKSPLSTDLCWHFEKELDDSYYAFECPIHVQSASQISQQREQISQRLGALTKGLLENGGPFIGYLHEALLSVTEAAKADDSFSNLKRICCLLDHFDLTTWELLRSLQVAVGGIEDLKDERLPFREEVLKHELGFYIKKSPKIDPRFFRYFPASPLFAALAPTRLASMPHATGPRRQTVEILLEYGKSPNSGSKTRHGDHLCTPWLQFVTSAIPEIGCVYDECELTDPRWGIFRRAVEDGLFDLILCYGANPNELLHRGSEGDRTVFANYLILDLSGRFGGQVQERFIDEYIHIFFVFLQAGARLDVPVFETERRLGGKGWVSRLPPKSTIFAAFCSKLRDSEVGFRVPTRARGLFLVCEALISNLPARSSEMEALVSTIKDVCPPHLREDLLALAFKNRTRKRLRDREGPVEPLAKRQRFARKPSYDWLGSIKACWDDLPNFSLADIFGDDTVC
ncbi:hypothetical protein ACJZ2D_006246 [Fusarium nematophilum]